MELITWGAGGFPFTGMFDLDFWVKKQVRIKGLNLPFQNFYESVT